MSKEILRSLLKESSFKDNPDKIREIIDEFTESHSSHGFPISRRQLIEVGFQNVKMSEENPSLHAAIKMLFNAYMGFMRANNAVRLHGNRNTNMTEQVSKTGAVDQSVSPPITFG